ncbi:hypothetical protein OSTOST_16564, partial [Ostertagia ostertagi]
ATAVRIPSKESLSVAAAEISGSSEEQRSACENIWFCSGGLCLTKKFVFGEMKSYFLKEVLQ